MYPIQIRGGNSAHALVSDEGELIIRKFDYSTTYSVSLAVTSTIYEIVPGKAGQAFVLTDILVTSDRNFGSATTPENIQIYQAPSHDWTVNDGYLLNIDMLKNDRLVATGLNIKTGETKSLVAVASDTEATVVLAGYYISA